MAYKPEITEKLFELAKEVSPVNNARLCAAVVYKGIIISVGINSYKTHPRAVKLQCNEKKPYIHAEMSAIFQAQNQTDVDLSKCDIYVVRAKKVKKKCDRIGGCLRKYSISPCKCDSEQKYDWDYGVSKPCEGCSKLINEVKIKNVYCKL